MNEDTAAAANVTSILSGLGQLGDRFVAGLNTRLAALNGVPVAFDNLRASLAAGNIPPPAAVPDRLALMTRYQLRGEDAECSNRREAAFHVPGAGNSTAVPSASRRTSVRSQYTNEKKAGGYGGRNSC